MRGNKLCAILSWSQKKKGPWIIPEADFVEFCWLEQHVERVGAESGTGIDPHVDTEFLLPKPFAYSRHVVLVNEGESVGL